MRISRRDWMRQLAGTAGGVSAMVFDNASRVEKDPLGPPRAAMQRAMRLDP